MEVIFHFEYTESFFQEVHLCVELTDIPNWQDKPKRNKLELKQLVSKSTDWTLINTLHSYYTYHSFLTYLQKKKKKKEKERNIFTQL